MSKISRIFYKKEDGTFYEGQLLYYIVVFVTVVGGILAFVLCKMGFRFSWPTPCLFHDYAHLYCPGCGGTRAMYYILTGHLIKSIEYNPASLAFVLFMMYYIFGTFFTVLSRGEKRYFKMSWWMLAVAIFIVIWTGVIRNILAVYFGVDFIGDVAAYWIR